MSRFDEAIEALRAETGWEPVPSRRPGGVRFEFEGGPDLEIYSPDGRTLFLQALLAEPGPDEGPEPKAEALARQAAAAALKRGSILSFDGRAFHLHASLDLRGTEEITDQVRAFLNDWDWWQQGAAPAGPWPRP